MTDLQQAKERLDQSLERLADIVDGSVMKIEQLHNQSPDDSSGRAADSLEQSQQIADLTQTNIELKKLLRETDAILLKCVQKFDEMMEPAK